MTRRERLHAATRRQPVDRPPYAFWRHFPQVDRSPAGLAQATLRFHDRYGSDFLTIVPPAGYAAEAWGCAEAEAPGPDGARPCAACPIRRAEDWRRIRPVDPTTAPGLAGIFETIVRLGFDRRVGDAPVLLALPAPLSVARRLAGGRLGPDLREWPDAVGGALEAITDTLVRCAELVLDEGLAGFLYLIQAAGTRVLGAEAYARFGAPHDRRVLEAVRGRAALTIVHVQEPGDLLEEPLLVDLPAALPADAWGWADRVLPAALPDVQGRVPGAVVGGLDAWGTLHRGSPADAAAQAQEAVARTGGVGLVVAPGGVVPPATPDATLAAVVRALGGPLKPILGIAR
jgi:uroporphyrinogen-III decarboxylase